MESRDRQQRAIGRIVERIDDGRQRVDGRVIDIEPGDGIGGGIVFRALTDPAGDECNIRLRQRSILRGHGLLLVARHAHAFDEQALLALACLDRQAIMPALHEVLKRGHDEFALGLRRLVAAVAFRLKDGADFFIKTHRSLWFGENGKRGCK